MTIKSYRARALGAAVAGLLSIGTMAAALAVSAPAGAVVPHYTPTTGIPAAPTAVNEVVDSGGTIDSNCGAGLTTAPADVYSTISAAVTAASAGNTIYVCAGTYAETVTATNDLTIDGAQWSATAVGRSTSPTINSVITPPTNDNGVTYATGALSGTLSGLDLVNPTAAATSQIDGISAFVSGTGYTWTNNLISGFTVGIQFFASGTGDGTSIEGNAFENNTADPSNGASGQGIFDAGGASNNVTVENNAFSGDNAGPDGDDCDINTTGSGFGTAQTGWVIEDNTSEGAGNFLVLFETTGAVVSGNTVTGNNSSAFYIGGDNTGTSITGNSVSNGVAPNDIGIKFTNYAGFGYGDSSDLTASGNSITNEAVGIEGVNGYPGTAISNNTITTMSNDCILMEPGAIGYAITGNVLIGCTNFAIEDQNTGSGGTAGTGNTYSGNTGTPTSPTGLAVPPTTLSSTPTAGTTTAGTAFGVQLSASGATGTVTYVQTSGSPNVTVSSSGALNAPSTLAAGTYTAGGTLSDTHGDTGTFGFTLNITSATTPPRPTGGYDLVGSDGGVFVFNPPGVGGGFYGSLPGIHVHVNNIVGIVPTAGDLGYYLVGSDGGVFAFGDAPFFGSLPGQGTHVNDIAGIVPTANNQGYFLVGRDGGVFAFGNASFLGSLPGQGVHLDNVVGIAATSDDGGYWVVTSTGQVYNFGDAAAYGSANAAVTAIAATPDGHGYWLVGPDGGVFAFGEAAFDGSLPGINVHVENIVGIVHSADGQGYLLIGSDGGVFAFGDAPFEGSLPGINVHINNVVGAVPTA
jgi:hypothetical protein